MVKITQIVIKPEYLARASLDDDLVQEYAERMLAGDEFPPVQLVDVPGVGLLLANGFHRVSAWKMAGATEVPATVVQGDESAAVLIAIQANRDHGKRRSRDDLRVQITLALKHAEFVRRSDSWLAKDIGCDDKTVSAVRERLEAGSEIPNLAVLTGEDGKQYPRRQKPRESLFTVQPTYTIEQWESLNPKQRAMVLAAEPEGNMNRQEETVESAEEAGNIEWAKWSWNPITGCLHNCPYCYARDITERFNGTPAFPNGFAPTLAPKRLRIPQRDAPNAVKVEIDPSHRNIFTCSMSDLFGRWVPTEWIEAVLRTVADSPQWNFLFLTKFPKRMADFEFPANAWVGTSVDCQARVRNAERAFAKVRASVKWLSCEPIIEPLKFERLDLFQWLVLGGASRSSQTPAWRPPREWVDSLEDQARAAGVMVYEKTNLLRRHRQFPGHTDAPMNRAPDVFHYLGRAVDDNERGEVAVVKAA